MTSSPHGPYVLGYTRATMALTMGSKEVTLANPKNVSQFGLHSATRVHEAGIASNRNQRVAVNTFPGLVHTARHTMEVGYTLRQIVNLRETFDYGTISNWGEVVTR